MWTDVTQGLAMLLLFVGVVVVVFFPSLFTTWLSYVLWGLLALAALLVIRVSQRQWKRRHPPLHADTLDE